MQQLERIKPIAQRLLTLQLESKRRDAWLWERALRVSRLTQLIGHAPELAGRGIDLLAAGAAGLFHCAGWAAQLEQGGVGWWQLLARPTTDIQRELGAALLMEHAGPHLPAKTARLAADAIRQCNRRGAKLIEAQVLAEAESLDDIGAVTVLRQFRQYHAEGRPITQMIATWTRQQEYRYWELRISDFRFETTRELARARLEALGAYFLALTRELNGTDVLEALDKAGVEVPPDLRTIVGSEDERPA
ncbi:MAG: hypothetical protein KBH81_13975 [Phycisphaerae bacterium]|nr:hypothetical protein [Phycisphaerae bacterium]HPC23773.1 hypothetical protein [Phycisphaerae bacterium]HRS29471.1 hypothetical protein [Phycisphaerae bacterium]